MAVFWVIALSNPVKVYRRFRDASCLHNQGNGLDDGDSRLQGATTKKTAIFTVAGLRT
jgi:hypothetical protein